MSGRVISKYYSCFVALFVLFSPFNFLYETSSLMLGQLGYGGWAVSLTPVYIKILKDIFLIVSVLWMIGHLLLTADAKWVFAFFNSAVLFSATLFFVVIFLSFFWSLGVVPVEVLFSGFRAYWTVALVFVGFYLFDDRNRLFFRSFWLVFTIHLCFQFFQSVFSMGVPVFAEERNPGLFLVPTTAGAFSIIAFFLALRERKLLLILMALLSLYFSKSTIGIMVVVTFYFYQSYAKSSNKALAFLYLPIFFLLFAAFAFAYLGEISGRGDGALLSLTIRLSYIMDVISDIENLMFGRAFGIATSNAVLLGIDGAVVADNTVTGFFLNVGWFFSIFLIFLFVVSFLFFESSILFFLFFSYAMVSNIFEMTPVIQLLMLLLGANARRLYTNSPI